MRFMNWLLIVLMTSLMTVPGFTWAQSLNSKTSTGYLDNQRMTLKSTTASDGTVVTRGYIGNQRVSTKTVKTATGTKTTGYVGDKRVEIKEKR